MRRILLLGLVLLTLFVLACSRSGDAGPAAASPVLPAETLASGTTSPGDVLLELTPRRLEGGQLDVEVQANTHSVDLAQFDLTELSTLKSQGKSFKPLAASSLSGHHSTGQLSFPVEGDLQGFRIVIRGVPLAETRVYEWEG